MNYCRLLQTNATEAGKINSTMAAYIFFRSIDCDLFLPFLPGSAVKEAATVVISNQGIGRAIRTIKVTVLTVNRIIN